MPLERMMRQGCIASALAVAVFAWGMAIARNFAHTTEVRADSDRVFELRVYHCLPGKLPALEARFRDSTSKILAKHDLNVLGFWAADGPSASDNTFVFMLAYSNTDERKQKWAAVNADPAFQDVIKAEQSDKTVDKIDVTYLRPTDFSALR